MRKLLAVVAIAFALSGCAQLKEAVNFATVGVANPVTKNMLYEAENGAIVVFAGLNAYKQTCVQGAIPASCKDTIRAIQTYTRQIPPQLKTLRAFVRTNDQVNAPVVYNTIMQLLSNAKATASANGVNIGG